jgi:hypothetical protein
MSPQTVQLMPEQQRVLCACYECWRACSAPSAGQEICYTWVSGHHQRRFGGDCTPPQLR